MFVTKPKRVKIQPPKNLPAFSSDPETTDLASRDTGYVRWSEAAARWLRAINKDAIALLRELSPLRVVGRTERRAASGIDAIG